MKESNWKFGLLFAIVLLLQMVIVPLHFSADDSLVDRQLIDYVALGDSLAAGVTPNNELGKSYADFLAEKMDAVGALKSFNKGFAFAGFKTTDVLRELSEDVTRPVIGIGYIEETVSIQTSIAEAEVITISAGANDLLPIVLNAETGELIVNEEEIKAVLQQVAINYQAMMAQIRQLNREASVYVMGYYNPFPAMSAELQPQLDFLLEQLNDTIKHGIQGAKATFVPTGEVIAEDYLTYLPNTENIHLSEVGYKKVTEQFWRAMASHYPWMVESEFSDVSFHWAKEFIETAFGNEIMGGYEDGTFRPDNPLLRVEANAIIVRTLGLKTIEQAPFKDISSYSDRTRAEIAAGYKYGLVLGKDRNFMPAKEVSRAQLAMMIERAYEYKTGSKYTAIKTAPYIDIGNQSLEAINAISMLYDFGIATGSAGKFKPTNSVTRAEAARMLSNFAVLIE